MDLCRNKIKTELIKEFSSLAFGYKVGFCLFWFLVLVIFFFFLTWNARHTIMVQLKANASSYSWRCRWFIFFSSGSLKNYILLISTFPVGGENIHWGRIVFPTTIGAAFGRLRKCRISSATGGAWGVGGLFRAANGRFGKPYDRPTLQGTERPIPGGPVRPHKSNGLSYPSCRWIVLLLRKKKECPKHSFFFISF